MVKSCAECGELFNTNRPKQKYCGSLTLKFGCSFKAGQGELRRQNYKKTVSTGKTYLDYLSIDMLKSGKSDQEVEAAKKAVSVAMKGGMRFDLRLASDTWGPKRRPGRPRGTMRALEGRI